MGCLGLGLAVFIRGHQAKPPWGDTWAKTKKGEDESPVDIWGPRNWAAAAARAGECVWTGIRKRKMVLEEWGQIGNGCGGWWRWPHKSLPLREQGRVEGFKQKSGMTRFNEGDLNCMDKGKCRENIEEAIVVTVVWTTVVEMEMVRSRGLWLCSKGQAGPLGFVDGLAVCQENLEWAVEERSIRVSSGQMVEIACPQPWVGWQRPWTWFLAGFFTSALHWAASSPNCIIIPFGCSLKWRFLGPTQIHWIRITRGRAPKTAFEYKLQGMHQE